MQTGLYAARKIRHQAQGQTYDKPFRYHDLGSAAYPLDERLVQVR